MEVIIIILLLAILISLVAGAVRQFLNENPETIQNFLNDTGYELDENAIQVKAKVVDIFEPESSPLMPSPDAQYDGIVFKLEDGRRLDFLVHPSSSFAMNIGDTGMLYYLEPDKFLNFVPDKTPGNWTKLFSKMFHVKHFWFYDGN